MAHDPLDDHSDHPAWRSIDRRRGPRGPRRRASPATSASRSSKPPPREGLGRRQRVPAGQRTSWASACTVGDHPSDLPPVRARRRRARGAPTPSPSAHRRPRRRSRAGSGHAHARAPSAARPARSPAAGSARRPARPAARRRRPSKIPFIPMRSSSGAGRPQCVAAARRAPHTSGRTGRAVDVRATVGTSSASTPGLSRPVGSKRSLIRRCSSTTAGSTSRGGGGSLVVHDADADLGDEPPA